MAQNDAPSRLSSRNRSLSDNPNNERSMSRNEIQRAQDSNTTDTRTDQPSAFAQNALIYQNTDTISNTSAYSIRLEVRRRYLERQRSLDSLLTEALRISEEALAEMRCGSELQQAVTSTTQISRHSSHNNSSDNDGGHSNTNESSPRSLN
jgi:hypothetical protein